MKITINPEYEKLVPPLTQKDYEELKESIKNYGLWHPITINHNNEILDGHHRFKVIQELGWKFDNLSAITKIFATKIEEKLFVIDSNLKRRHLTIWQRLQLYDAKAEILRDQALKKKQAGKKSDLPALVPDAIIAKEAGVGERIVRMYRKVKKKANKKQIQTLDEDTSKIKKIYGEIQHEERREKAKHEAKNRNWSKYAGHDHYELFEGDILEMGAKIEDNSIDLIFTDPPYGKETIDVYAKLGELAVRVLKPGGSLVTIVAHHYIPEIHKMISDASDFKEGYSPFLKYHWLIVLRHGGQARRVHAYNVWAHYKPLLWYYKPMQGSNKPITYHDVMDLVESKPVDKDLHEWEQSTIEAENIIKSLTVENQYVLDPFMGSGTTGVAALRLGRKFKGIEINQETMNIANKRLYDADQKVNE